MIALVPILNVLLNVAIQASKAKRKVIFKRAESYVKEYLSKEKEEIRLKRAARTSGDFYVPSQPKVYFVVRIRGYVVFFP
jgi:large subunit ribosomal protein L7e